MLEIHRDVVTSDVRRHGNDRGMVELSDQVTSGDPVEIWHDDVHQHHVVFGSSVHLVHSLETVELGQSAKNVGMGTDLRLTALSIAQWNEYRNLLPILRHVGSSSTSNICGDRTQPGSICALFFLPAGAATRFSSMLLSFAGIGYGMLLMCSLYIGSIPLVWPTGYTIASASP